MQAPKPSVQNYASRLFRIAEAPTAPVVMSAPEPQVEARGLNSAVRFFVDYSISVAVNSVARRQALRAKLNLSTPDGLVLKVVVSTANESGESQFVAYSDATSLFVNSSSGLFVTNQTPRELEHSIYLYLTERLCGKQVVNAEVVRETNSAFSLPVLVGSSQDGPRSLHVKAAP